MNNYNYTRPPRKGVIVFVSFVFAAIFGIAFFSAYEQRTDLGHSVHLSPTSANYGTVSTVHPQALTVPMQSSAPMLSGGAIRSYAYSGHATMPKASGSGSGFKMYTTSSASVHSLGSGGGGGGSMSGGSSHANTSSKGIHYSGGSISMPTLALATPTYGAQSSTPTRFGMGRRRVIIDDSDGEPGERRGDTDGSTWWYWNEDEGWVTESEGIPNGTIWNDNGVIKTWNATTSEWEVTSGHVSDPTNVPLGDAPWHWMLLLAIAYVSTKVLRKRIESLSSITID